MGKTSLKTAWRPRSLRLVGAASVCRNSMYELVCNSIKLGGAMIFLILPKLIRSVARDGILDLYWVVRHKTGLFFLNKRDQARTLCLTVILPFLNLKAFWDPAVCLNLNLI